jgi:hypothetical protein
MTDPYARNMFGQFNPYFAKRPVVGRLVVVLDGTFDERGLQLIKPTSRALQSGEIHELIISDEPVIPGVTVNRIAYVGFMEVTRGGVIVAGDPVRIGEKLIGSIGGYDETHMPNHLNITLTGERISGREWDLCLEWDVVIG